MRLIDSVDPSAPVHGTFVVRSVTEGCPGDPPISSRGCPAWRVLAKVADVSVPVPTATPSATASPTSTTPTVPKWDPSQSALTTAELGTVLDSGELQKYERWNQILVVDATIGAAPAGACAAADTLNVAAFQLSIAGVVAGLDPPACVYADGKDSVPQSGLLVLRTLGGRQLGYMATVTMAHGQLAYRATDGWPQGFALVDAWLDFDPADCGDYALPAHGGPQPLHPGYSQMCYAALSDSQPPDRPSSTSAPTAATSAEVGPGVAGPIPTYAVPADGKALDAAPWLDFPTRAPLAVPASQHGVFLVHYDPACSNFNPTDCEQWRLLGQVDSLDLSPTPNTP